MEVHGIYTSALQILPGTLKPLSYKDRFYSISKSGIFNVILYV